MCLLLWTLPNNNHPRIRFAFASNRDECLDRPTSTAEFWDITPPGSNNISSPGIICGVDRKPPKANLRPDRALPGTWVGITTEGDLVALTDYMEASTYYERPTPTPPKPTRGQLCGDFLVAMAESGHGKDQAAAEQWIRRYAQEWDTSLEGLNLLVVQDAGDQQFIGANREGSDLLALHEASGRQTVLENQTTLTSKIASALNKVGERLHPSEDYQEEHPRITEGAVAGLSNSVFLRPWRRVEIGVQALEAVLNKSLKRFGTDQTPRILPPVIDSSPPTPIPSENVTPIQVPFVKEQFVFDDESKELVWLVIEMLTLLRIHTRPYPGLIESFEIFATGIRDRVFIPRTGLKHLCLPHVRGEYGTRSSTVVLFGRSGRAVFVEKNWYAPLDEETGERPIFDVDSTEGVIWWQGQIGRPRDEWTRIKGAELEALFDCARDSSKTAKAL